MKLHCLRVRVLRGLTTQVPPVDIRSLGADKVVIRGAVLAGFTMFAANVKLQRSGVRKFARELKGARLEVRATCT